MAGDLRVRRRKALERLLRRSHARIVQKENVRAQDADPFIVVWRGQDVARKAGVWRHAALLPEIWL